MRWALAAATLLIGCADDPLYGPCDTAGDCADPADGCYELRYDRSDGTSAEGRTCTTRCRDGSCPNGGRCLALAGDPSGTFLCFAPCETSMDCFEGHACTETSGAGDSKICLPQ